ncbi:ABC transporter ATP-binding protein [Robertkochia solimangrovi]|uniref:ABC transporter ATP-binding protein n=1 Tax=Robertkochia solimangrovi TaxID=2213046 RepID=UPI00117CDE9F|nr:ABC transporter ATP-binding protein [Robertkochia solimangrovi]TRZ46130.1 ABC transporter ATP-binding protein [Robertkochia solimangrovi]
MLKVSNLSFSYDDRRVLHKINFELTAGEQLSIIGESGSGKSTLLKIIYGLLHVDQGELTWNGEKLLGPLYHLVPGEDFMKYQAQDFDLQHTLTIEEHIGKYLSNFYLKKKKARIQELLELVDMQDHTGKKPNELSGGQQQRIALARVLAKEPKLLLLDEPFSNIDNNKKNKLRRQLFSYLRENKISCIVATHENTDSLSYSDRTLVLKKGQPVALDTPYNLYQFPKNKYVAGLFGEVNDISMKYFEGDPKDKVLLYPEELFAVKNGGVPVTIRQSFYEGNGYLTEANCGRKKILFKTKAPVEPGSRLQLSANASLIKSRLNQPK